MTRMRMIMLSLLAVFAVGAVASASASAASLEWEVCEKVGANKGKFETHKCIAAGGTNEWEWKLLAAGEERKVVSEGGTFTLKGGPIESTCTKVLDEGDIFGGKPGTDLTLKILFEGCTTSKAGCKVKSAKGTQAAGEILVTNVPTELIITKTAGGVEVEADLFKGTKKPPEKEFVTLEFGEAEKVLGTVRELEKKCGETVPLTTQVTGSVAAETVGSGELNFPEPPLEASKLKAFGAINVKLIGKDTQAVVSVFTEKLSEGWAVRAS